MTYDGRDVETYSCDSWGKVIASTRNGRKATYRYDYFGRLIEKTEDGAITRYAYNAWGQRTARETVNGSLKLTETREYDAPAMEASWHINMTSRTGWRSRR